MSGFRGGPWDDGDPVDEHTVTDAHAGRRRVSPLVATVVAAVVASVALVTGAARLASADFGTSLRARVCDGSPLLGLALLALGGLALGLVASFHAQVAAPTRRLRLDGAAVAWMLPIPALLLVVTLPGVMGCRAAQRFEDLVLVGNAFIGMSGAMLAAGASVLVGASLASALRPDATVLVGGERDDATTAVIEAAIDDAHDPHTGRFRGVDG